MSPLQPVIAPEIFVLRPDFRALSIHAGGVSNSVGTPETTAALESACRHPVVSHGQRPIVRLGGRPTGLLA